MTTSSSVAGRTDSLDPSPQIGTPPELRTIRSSRSHAPLQISWASLVRLASNARVGLPSTSSVNTREKASFISRSSSNSAYRSLRDLDSLGLLLRVSFGVVDFFIGNGNSAK